MVDKRTEPTEGDLAMMSRDQLEAYADTLNDGEPEPGDDQPQRLESVVSVRFAVGEVETLRQRADAAGMRLTAYIREMSLREAGDSVDLRAIREHLGEAELAMQRAAELASGAIDTPQRPHRARRRTAKRTRTGARA